MLLALQSRAAWFSAARRLGMRHYEASARTSLRTLTVGADRRRDPGDCSHRKGIVLDSFSGSGTILIAAERTGRRARAIELDPFYVDVAVQG